MSQCALIECGITKKDYPCRADEMYCSDLVQKKINYARSILPDEHIYIVSSYLGVIGLATELEPYDYYDVTRASHKAFDFLMARYMDYNHVVCLLSWYRIGRSLYRLVTEEFPPYQSYAITLEYPLLNMMVNQQKGWLMRQTAINEESKRNGN